MKEEWTYIPGFTNYIISNYGQVKNIQTNKIKSFDKSGRSRLQYNSVRLYENGKRYKLVIHKLVWLAFNGDIPDGYHIDHMDRDNTNNRLDNLRCVTEYENVTGKCHEAKLDSEVPF